MDKKEILLTLSKAIIEIEEELAKAEAQLEKKAPPGWSEETMHKLKREHGVESAFKIAWAAYNKKHGKTDKSEKKADSKKSKKNWFPSPKKDCPDCGGEGVIPGSGGSPCWCLK
jgi:hypothetical protein